MLEISVFVEESLEEWWKCLHVAEMMTYLARHPIPGNIWKAVEEAVEGAAYTRASQIASMQQWKAGEKALGPTMSTCLVFATIARPDKNDFQWDADMGVYVPTFVQMMCNRAALEVDRHAAVPSMEESKTKSKCRLPWEKESKPSARSSSGF
ncbi:uncharacterized protein FIBRA_08874 [Fibroporia radiculosa]|uniref:Uncharacterized protein n=1 Tax=Fibroporia radiculosa TaxID=599839 RepID=J4GXJ7_9APHY|nr:uncharacterized protein FIBRA_08874 [Fibroporia radiculosa]CCM06595.1 predicted protein [Fibroporia radiculosa]